MAVGEIQNQNDTPIGGNSEYRANVQNGDVFGVSDVPAWDGTKFVPASNSALIYAYGGLLIGNDTTKSADGSVIAGWGIAQPTVPVQTTPDIVSGGITVALSGVYEINFTINCIDLTNNQEYLFSLTNGVITTDILAAMVGSNQVTSQTTSFSALFDGNAGGAIGVICDGGSQDYTVIAASFTAKRIG